MGWVAAVDGYEVCLDDGKVACRTTAGKPLKTLPKQVRDSDAVAALRQVQEWLERHEAQCLRTVEDWLLRGLPVPATVIAAVWPDEAWRTLLSDMVVVPVAAPGSWQVGEGGFLRSAGADGLGVVNLDGETVRLRSATVALPHPVLLDDLEELRGFAAELGIRQDVAQLFREIWRVPADTSSRRAELSRYAGGRFAQLRQLTSRAASLGYAVRGGCATLRVWEQGRALEARVWLGDHEPSEEAQTGDLVFVDSSGSAVSPEDVGPVGWSEGMRMAAGLFAGRVVEAEAQP